VVGVAAVQVNVFLNTVFASSERGAVSWLNYAFRFLQFPIGVFGVAIGTVSTTRYADAAADADPRAIAAHLVEALRLLLFLTVPATPTTPRTSPPRSTASRSAWSPTPRSR
jgi:putative peptidoglycan lipid II flippase